MVEQSIQSVIKAEHELEHLVESSTGGSQDATERDFQEMRRLTEQAALAAFKATTDWGKESLNKAKEHIEEISL